MLKSTIDRRRFIKRLLSSTASFLSFYPFSKLLNASPATLEPRQRIPNPYVTTDGRPIVVCVSGDNYQRMLQTGLAALGGLDRLVDSNQSVLIKPNCVYPEAYPTTSDVDSVVSTIEAVRAVSSGVINVGDSGGSDNQYIYDYLGIEEAVTGAGANLLLFEDTYNVRRNSWDSEVPDFKVWSDIYDTPVLINLCALKRHYAGYMTCAIKHHVGAVAGPNRQETRGYLHNFNDRSYEFLTTLSEMAGLVNPELTIVDARQVMAINGPLRSHGGEIRDCGKVILGGDIIAVDCYCAQLLSQYDETFDPEWIEPTIERAVRLGLGQDDLEQVEIIELEQTSIDDFTDRALPDRVVLYQNYPNPFNVETTIRFDLPKKDYIRMEIYDSLGRKIATAADGLYQPGVHYIAFNASGLSSGVYYYELISSSGNERKALVLIK